jgi:hypothetical protein
LNKFSARCVPNNLKIELATDNPIFGATGFVLVGAAPANPSRDKPFRRQGWQ